MELYRGRLIDHLHLVVRDIEASRRFYETVLAPLGHVLTSSGGHYDEWNDFGIAQAREDRPATRGLHPTASLRRRTRWWLLRRYRTPRRMPSWRAPRSPPT